MTNLLIAYGMLLGSTLMIWVGYPVAVWGWSLAFGDDAQPNPVRGSQARVSVLLATRDDFSTVAARVANLLETEHPLEHLEIVVARDARSDVVWPDDAQWPSGVVRVVGGNPHGGKAATLNAAAEAARGEYLVLADAAQRFASSTIPELVAALMDQRFGAVSGALEISPGESGSPIELYWRLEKWLRFHESRIHSSIGVTGAVYALRRELWPRIPEDTLLDDVFVPMSVVLSGFRVGFVQSAKAWDNRRFTSAKESERKTRTLTGILQLLSLLPEVLRRENPVRVQFVLHKLARLLTPLLLALQLPLVLLMWVTLLIGSPIVVTSATGVVVAPAVLVPSLRRKCLSALTWGFDMQRATLAALRNGVRGNWAVWAKVKS